MEEVRKWTVSYTKHVRQKRKLYHDGFLHLHSNNKVKLKEAMEKAFWDGLMESMRQEQLDFSWVLKLMTEVRDEL